MKKTHKFVFIVLTIVAWIIFVGLCIEAGALLVNFIYSLVKPEIVKKLYQKLDLSTLYQSSKWAYYAIYSFILVISGLKAYLFYQVTTLIHKFDLAKPFNAFVSGKISQISYVTFSIGMLSYLANGVVNNLKHRGYVIDNLNGFWSDSQAFILMSAIIYIIAVIFAKGVELQNENDLTV